MRKEPLISILMPVRNTEAYLVECLDSILAQRYTNWELIAINDHSTDNSFQILKNYALLHPNIKVFNNQGKGIIEALRTAYSHTKGELITRMDSDDIMPTHKLEQLSQQLLAAGLGHLATGLVSYFSANDLGQGYERYAEWLNSLTMNGSNFNELYKECVIPSPCWMVFREDLEACDAFRPNRYPEDYDLCFRFYEQGLTCLASQEILHHWRDSSTRTSRHDPNYANNNFLDIKIHYFLKLNYTPYRPLVLWGAGKKGKYLAQIFKKSAIPFYWLCNNEKKIGKHIYEVVLQDTSYLKQLKNPQIIVAIAEPEAQANIKAQFKQNNRQAMKDFFFFC